LIVLIESLWYVSLVDESCQVWVSHDTLLGTCVRERERGCVCACVCVHVSERVGVLTKFSWTWLVHVTHVDESCHIWMGHGSCHIWMSHGSCQAVGRAIFFRFSFLRQVRFHVLFCWSAYAHTLSLSLSLFLTHTRAHTHTHTHNLCRALSLACSLALLHTRTHILSLCFSLSLSRFFLLCTLLALSRSCSPSLTHTHTRAGFHVISGIGVAVPTCCIFVLQQNRNF